MIMRITIPECKEVFGDDGDNNRTFLYVQIQLMIMVRGLHEQYHHLGIGEPDYAETAIIDDAVRALSSFYTLADLRQDYNSCAVILRSLVDKIAVLKLIYANLRNIILYIIKRSFHDMRLARPALPLVDILRRYPVPRNVSI